MTRPHSHARRWNRVAGALAALVASVLIAACGDEETPGEPGPEGTDAAEAGEAAGQRGLRAPLEPLSGSGVSGRAILSQLGSTLRVQTTVSGLEPREQHVQHIHRLDGGEPGNCPGKGDDGDGDGTLTLEEALPAYGPVALKLEPFPRATRRGDVSFQGTFRMPPELEPLPDRVLVVYGMDVDGVYDPTVPVACGRIG